MSELDPIQALLALGLISQDVVDGAARVSPSIASTRAGRLIAAGADPAVLLEQLSQLSGIPLASPEMLAKAQLVDVPAKIRATLRGAMACPVRVDESGAIEIVVADPEARATVIELLPSSRLYLAPEIEVRLLFGRLDEQAKNSVLRDVGKRVERPWEPPSDAKTIEGKPRAASALTPARGSVPPPLKREGTTGVRVIDRPHDPTRRAFLLGAAAGAGAMLVIAVVAAVLLWPASPPPSVDANGTIRRQAALVAEARKRALAGEHAWALSKCTDAIELDATSPIAAEAYVVCGKSKLILGDPTAMHDLQRALTMLPEGDPLRAEVELALMGR